MCFCSCFSCSFACVVTAPCFLFVVFRFCGSFLVAFFLRAMKHETVNLYVEVDGRGGKWRQPHQAYTQLQLGRTDLRTRAASYRLPQAVKKKKNNNLRNTKKHEETLRAMPSVVSRRSWIGRRHLRSRGTVGLTAGRSQPQCHGKRSDLTPT